jgi:heme-degrading monooxygenase HmoA
MIARTWRGWTRADDADAYADYVAATGLAAYRATPGNRGAWVLTRVDGDRAEILAVSLWDDLGAIRAFAGDDLDRAVFYPEDDRYLVAREMTALHWAVRSADEAVDA